MKEKKDILIKTRLAHFLSCTCCQGTCTQRIPSIDKKREREEGRKLFRSTRDMRDFIQEYDTDVSYE